VLDQMLEEDGVRVAFGDELEDPSLRHCARGGPWPRGALGPGVIGLSRMDYLRRRVELPSTRSARGQAELRSPGARPRRRGAGEGLGVLRRSPRARRRARSSRRRCGRPPRRSRSAAGRRLRRARRRSAPPGRPRSRPSSRALATAISACTRTSRTSGAARPRSASRPSSTATRIVKDLPHREATADLSLLQVVRGRDLDGLASTGSPRSKRRAVPSIRRCTRRWRRLPTIRWPRTR
jgi:hypothetical protein